MAMASGEVLEAKSLRELRFKKNKEDKIKIIDENNLKIKYFLNCLICIFYKQKIKKHAGKYACFLYKFTGYIFYKHIRKNNNIN